MKLVAGLAAAGLLAYLLYRRQRRRVLKIKPLHPFGACVDSASVETLLTSGPALRRAWLDHGGLLVVRDLSGLTAREMHAISALFGEVEAELDDSKQAYRVGGLSSVMRIGNLRDSAGELVSMHTISAPLPPDGCAQYRRDQRTPVWHTDSVYRQRPPVGSALYCKIAPPSGAATCFADAAAAFAALEPEVQTRLHGLEVLCSLAHHDAKVKARGSPDYPTLTDEQRRRNPAQRAPCVLTHPLTGREALYGMNSGTCAVLPKGTPVSPADLDRYELEAFEDPTVEAELRALLPFATSERFVVQWRWRAGDMVIWDNRSTIHCATGFDWRRYTREMWRTTIVSDRDDDSAAWEISQRLSHQGEHQQTTDRLNALGFVADATDTGTISYWSTRFSAPQLVVEQLVMVPHGKTPSNVKLLFQSHAEGPDGQLLQASLDDAALGADEFLAGWGARLRERPSDFVFLRSPLHRTAQTADVYVRKMAEQKLPTPEIAVDEGLLEINQGSWHGKSVDQLSGANQWSARKYRGGSFFAAPPDGESNLDVLERCREWLLSTLTQPAVRGKVVVVFGHGTYQNAAETLLLTFGMHAKAPCQIFTRTPGCSHLRRGYPHVVYPPN